MEGLLSTGPTPSSFKTIFLPAHKLYLIIAGGGAKQESLQLLKTSEAVD